ncbi:NAD/FAD dependent dehydrogenase [Thraustotheca clavata]|uniref:NAD/FAD dependent dehydrogenase n=1 Tax=Thraustotheca clavata TaxID=74557 RepID=A0A1W0ABN4_9STRA|nr:NAD/FAD dependent dehydrogenase [Thraustotheca clavata]
MESLDKKFANIGVDLSSVRVKGRSDALKLQSKVNEWQSDVNTLATRIDEQIKNCKVLRMSKAIGLVTPSTIVSKGDVDPFHLLRSDIRSLYDFRLSYFHSYLNNQDNTIDFDAEAEHIKVILREPATVDKAPDAHSALKSMLKFTTTKGDLFSKIIDDMFRKKQQIDIENGIEEDMSSIDGNASLLLSLELCQDFLREHPKKRQSGYDVATPPSNNRQLFSSSTDTEASKSSFRLDEANFTIQKLHREINEIKITNERLTASNSQLEDNYAHILLQYEVEKKGYQESIQTYEPKIQKLEEEIKLSAAALSQLRLNVDLITNMYKKTCDEVLAFDESRAIIATERDSLARKLHAEVKKIATLNLEIERKDKLVMFAMGARHEALESLKSSRQELREITVNRDSSNTRISQLNKTIEILGEKLLQATKMYQEQEEIISQGKKTFETLCANVEQMNQAHKLDTQKLTASYEEVTMQEQDDQLQNRIARRVDRVRVLVQELTHAVRVISTSEHPQRPHVHNSISSERDGPYSRIIANNDRGVINDIERLNSMAIMVVGLNSIGCMIAETFCRSGIEKIFISHEPGNVSQDDLQGMFFDRDNIGYDRIAEVENNLLHINHNIEIEQLRFNLHSPEEYQEIAREFEENNVHLAFLCLNDAMIVRNMNELCLERNIPLIMVRPGHDGLSGRILTSIRGQTPCLLCAMPSLAPPTSAQESRKKNQLFPSHSLALPMIDSILAGFASQNALKYLNILQFGPNTIVESCFSMAHFHHALITRV